MLEKAKLNSRCKKCGQKRHWSGDAACSKSGGKGTSKGDAEKGGDQGKHGLMAKAVSSHQGGYGNIAFASHPQREPEIIYELVDEGDLPFLLAGHVFRATWSRHAAAAGPDAHLV